MLAIKVNLVVRYGHHNLFIIIRIINMEALKLKITDIENTIYKDIKDINKL
jgi:hypothetical protein